MTDRDRSARSASRPAPTDTRPSSDVTDADARRPRASDAATGLLQLCACLHPDLAPFAAHDGPERD